MFKIFTFLQYNIKLIISIFIQHYTPCLYVVDNSGHDKGPSIHQAIKYAFMCSIQKINSSAKDIFNAWRQSKIAAVVSNSGYMSEHIHITSSETWLCH